ncbi:MAG: cytochrome ubiquinol oxidase subunit I, partial [Hyphomicrobiaceae bacterium]
NDVYCTRSIPHVTSREPLWDQPGLAEDVEAGRHYLPNAPTGRRETIVTTAIEAKPDYILRMPGPGWAHFFAAVFTAGFFLLLTVKLVVLASISGILAVVSCLVWAWELDPEPSDPVDIGGGIMLPTYRSGPSSHAWWAVIVLMVVAGSLYLAFVFSYLYVWTVSPSVWGGTGSPAPPPVAWPIVSGSLYLASAAAFLLADRFLPERHRSGLATAFLLVAAALLAIAAVGVDILGHWQTGLRPSSSSYGALVYLGIFLSAQIIAAVAVMALFTAARQLAGRLDRVRRVTFDSTALLAYYACAQAIVGLVLVNGFPRLL